jgi:hypothetical protein
MYVCSQKTLKGRDHLGQLDADGRILKCILEKQDVKWWNGLNWLWPESTSRLL